MVNDRGRKRLPPYISYRTFRNFVDGLQQGMPARIDRSYWGDRLSGSTGTQLMAALRFLALVDANGIPTSQLKQLASAKGDKRTELLRQITYEAYGFLFQGSFDPQTATYAQLDEAFHHTFQLTSDVSRKCIKFFISVANDAGIPLSTFITKRLRAIHSVSGTKTITPKIEGRTSRKLIVPQDFEEIPFPMSWDKMLLAKFPTFDPTWTDEVKLKWFEAFDKLLERDFSKGKK
ncbi:MAG: hypothetical protein ACETVW_04070 [Dehalococcoidia bacterium]